MMNTDTAIRIAKAIAWTVVIIIGAIVLVKALPLAILFAIAMTGRKRRIRPRIKPRIKPRIRPRLVRRW